LGGDAAEPVVCRGRDRGKRLSPASLALARPIRQAGEQRGPPPHGPGAATGPVGCRRLARSSTVSGAAPPLSPRSQPLSQQHPVVLPALFPPRAKSDSTPTSPDPQLGLVRAPQAPSHAREIPRKAPSSTTAVGRLERVCGLSVHRGSPHPDLCAPQRPTPRRQLVADRGSLICRWEHQRDGSPQASLASRAPPAGPPA